MGIFQPALTTRAMSAVYEKYAPSVEEYVKAFRCAPLQAGVIFVIPGSCIGADLFDNPATLRRLFAKLVRSYALDALESPQGTHQGADGRHAAKLVEQITAASTFSEPAVGIGEDFRIDDPSVSGAARWALDRYVHLCAFVPDRPQGSTESRIRISGPGRRYSRQTRVH
jgi:hypothetical protein